MCIRDRPKSNRIIEKGRIENNIDLKLIDNKYKNLNVSSILHNDNSFNYNLNKLLYSIYYESRDKLTTLSNEYSMRDIILDNIKYKNIGGVRLSVKGRLTKRYRADRAVFKLRWKGGLKNIDSAFKGLSTATYRGFMDSNVESSRLSSKRRIGAFGIKSWVAGKSYSTMANQPTNSNIYTSLHPGFITGFSDAEGSFMVTIYKDNTRQIGWAIKLIFRISLHVRDLAILEPWLLRKRKNYFWYRCSNKIWIFRRDRGNFKPFWRISFKN